MATQLMATQLRLGEEETAADDEGLAAAGPLGVGRVAVRGGGVGRGEHGLRGGGLRDARGEERAELRRLVRRGGREAREGRRRRGGPGLLGGGGRGGHAVGWWTVRFFPDGPLRRDSGFRFFIFF